MPELGRLRQEDHCNFYDMLTFPFSVLLLHFFLFDFRVLKLSILYCKRIPQSSGDEEKLSVVVGHVVHTCNPNPQEAEARDCHELEARAGYVMSSKLA